MALTVAALRFHGTPMAAGHPIHGTLDLDVHDTLSAPVTFKLVFSVPHQTTVPGAETATVVFQDQDLWDVDVRLADAAPLIGSRTSLAVHAAAPDLSKVLPQDLHSAVLHLHGLFEGREFVRWSWFLRHEPTDAGWTRHVLQDSLKQRVFDISWGLRRA